MNDRDNTQARRTEPRFEPQTDAAGETTHTPAPATDYPETGDMPAWLRDAEPEASLVDRYGRPALMWGGALLAVAAVAYGAMWLRGEQKAHSELNAIAMSSRAADAAIIAAAPPAPVVPERRDVKVPPMVTLTPDGAAVIKPPESSDAAPMPAPAPAIDSAAVAAAAAAAPVLADTAPVSPAPAVATPAPKKPAAKPVVAKAPVKAAPSARRTLAAAPWPPAPSRKLPLAQNVLPKVKAKPVAPAKAKLAKAVPAARKAVPAKPVRGTALASRAKVQPKVQPKKVAGVMLPQSRPRAAELAPVREYPRDPVPIPRSCAKGELARDCAN